VSEGGQTLGARVRSARRDAGISQAQLAGDELTKGFISQIESGQVRPSIRSLQHIAAKLGRPLDYFIADEPLATTKRVAFHRLAAEAAAAARVVGLRLAGVDVIAPTLDRSLAESGGVVLEVNCTPGLHHHYLVADREGATRVAVPILRALLR